MPACTVLALFPQVVFMAGVVSKAEAVFQQEGYDVMQIMKEKYLASLQLLLLTG
jgi:hypothetical protein